MESYGWRGQGGPNQPETGIAQALDYYARYGGELLGARRSDNPLTLTHVRWHDQSGHVYDASHSPEMSGEIDSAEREVWVQLALDLPVAAAGMYGARAPWERLALDQGRAAELLTQLRRSLASRTSGSGNNPAPWSSGAPMPMPMPTMQRPPNQPFPPNRPVGNSGWSAGQPPESTSAYPPSSPFQPLPQQAPPSSLRGAPLPGAGMPGGPGFMPRPENDAPPLGSQGAMGAGRDWSNPVRPVSDPEVTVIPCIEVELPPVLTDPAAADQARDFTRDVARHFNRSAHQLQQIRETRGWMRNGRMVLAARLAIAPGSRVPSSIEMENAARMLSDVLTRNMLPYTRMTFAEPGEWTQGIALPE
jgi:hypothetical protein